MTDTAPYANVNLERQVLGQMLRFSGAFSAYSACDLRREDFFRHVHRLVFDAVTAVAGRGDVPDLVSVGLELRKAGTLEDVGPAYFSALVDQAIAPRADTALVVTAELAELAGKRAVAQSLGESLEDVAVIAEQATTRRTDARRVFDAAAQLELVDTDTHRDAGAQVWLGMPALDTALGGIRRGEVLGLMARPGIGKTLMLCHVARRMADEDGIGHVFFSLEMPGAQIVDRLASAAYELSRTQFRERLRSGMLDRDEYLRTFERFVLVDAPGLSVAQMAMKLRQIQAGPLRGVPIRLVTIDHLGLVGGDRKMTTYDRVSTQAREVKELAKRFECSVVMAVQVNRDQGGDGSRELGLGAARDSGVVEEAMDYLVALRRFDRSQTLEPYDRERYRDVLFAKVVKHRHGTPDSEVALRIDARTLALTEDRTIEPPDQDVRAIAAKLGRRR